MNLIREVFEFEYSNGFKQLKYIIAQDDYINIIKPLLQNLSNDKDNSRTKLIELVGDIDIYNQLIPTKATYYNTVVSGFIQPQLKGNIIHVIKTVKIQ